MTRRGQFLFFLPGMLLFLMLVILPMTATWLESFKQADGTHGVRLYAYAMSDARFHEAWKNNLAYFGWTLISEVALGLALAAGLEKPTRFHQWLRLIFFAPAVLSMVVVGLVFGFLFKDGVGVFPGWLNESNALLTISVISGWASAGIFMVMFLGGLVGIPEEVLEAARLDGANAWQIFWRIKLPLLKDVFAVAVLVCFTGAFKAFDLFWVLFRNQEGGNIVATMLVRESLQFGHRSYGSVLAVILTLFVVSTTLLAIWLGARWKRKGMA